MERRKAGLWHQPDFMKLWVGQAISAFGSHITWQALPLTAMLILAASPTELGLLVAAGTAPVVVFGLVAGVWVDRLRRRPLMIAADLGRAFLLGSIPVAALFGWLSMAQLFIVTGLTGTLTLLFDVADQSYLPSLVEHEHIVEGNSKISASRSLAEITGQPAGGLLVQLITAPFAIAIDAVSFIISALCVSLIRKPEKKPGSLEQPQPVIQEALEGLRVVYNNDILKALALCEIQRTFFGEFIGTLYMIYIIRELQMPVWVTGVLVGVGGISSLLGSVIAERITRRFGIGKTLIGAAIITAAINALIPLSGGPFMAAFTILLLSQSGDAAWSISFINETSLRQAVTAGHQLGRVNATVYFLVGGAALVGAIGGGILGDLIGVRPTMWLAVGGTLLAGLWLIFSPVRQLVQLPENNPTVEELTTIAPVEIK
jgi:predicted MFS family arabinose efflux permease